MHHVLSAPQRLTRTLPAALLMALTASLAFAAEPGSGTGRITVFPTTESIGVPEPFRVVIEGPETHRVEVPQGRTFHRELNLPEGDYTVRLERGAAALKEQRREVVPDTETALLDTDLNEHLRTFAIVSDAPLQPLLQRGGAELELTEARPVSEGYDPQLKIPEHLARAGQGARYTFRFDFAVLPDLPVTVVLDEDRRLTLSPDELRELAAGQRHVLLAASAGTSSAFREWFQDRARSLVLQWDERETPGKIRLLAAPEPASLEPPVAFTELVEARGLALPGGVRLPLVPLISSESAPVLIGASELTLTQLAAVLAGLPEPVLTAYRSAGLVAPGLSSTAFLARYGAHPAAFVDLPLARQVCERLEAYLNANSPGGKWRVTLPDRSLWSQLEAAAPRGALAATNPQAYWPALARDAAEVEGLRGIRGCLWEWLQSRPGELSGYVAGGSFLTEESAGVKALAPERRLGNVGMRVVLTFTKGGAR
ncbi:MAG: hypothetical protein ACFB21_15200 [Opitutales bacterium]